MTLYKELAVGVLHGMGERIVDLRLPLYHRRGMIRV